MCYPLLHCSNFIGTEDDHEDNADYLNLPLSSAGVRIDHGALLSVEDQSQKLAVRLRIAHRAEWNEEEQPEMFVLSAGEKEKGSASPANVDGAAAAAAAAPVAAASAEPAVAPAAAAAASPATTDEQKQESVAPVAAAAMEPSESPAAAAAAPSTEVSAPATAAVADTDGPAASSSHKRKYEEIDVEESDAAAKKLRADASAADSDVIELD